MWLMYSIWVGQGRSGAGLHNDSFGVVLGQKQSWTLTSSWCRNSSRAESNHRTNRVCSWAQERHLSHRTGRNP